jgi:drug/metabolite transporter (DMT)-like permease
MNSSSVRSSALPRFSGVSSRALAGVSMALFGAVLFSGKAVVVKLTYRYGVDAVTLIALRMLFAAPFFAAVAWRESRRARRGETPGLTRRECPTIWGLGILGYYLSSFFDFLGLRSVTVGLERLILFLSPSMVLLMSAFWFKRAVTRDQWASMLLCYLGVVLVFAHDLSQHGAGSEVLTGSLYVLASAFTYALYLIGSGELVKRVGATRLVAYAMLVSCLCCAAQYFAMHDLNDLLSRAPGVYAYSLVHAFFNTVVPVFLLMWAVAIVGAPTASMLGMVGPVSVLFLGWWFLDEPITLWQLLGTALVLAGVFVLSGGQVRKSKSR